MPRLVVLSTFLVLLGWAASMAAEMQPGHSRHPSPVAVAVSPDAQLLASANRDRGSVTIINLQAKTPVSELHCGADLQDLVWVDSATLAVTSRAEGKLILLTWTGTHLELTDSIVLGDEPTGLAVALSGKVRRLFVALTGQGQVAVVDLVRREVLERLQVGHRPKYLAVSPDQHWLVTCCELPGAIYVHETRTGRLVSRREILDEAFNLGRPAISPDSSTCIVPVAVNRGFSVTAGNIRVGWVINNRLVQLSLPDGRAIEQRQLGLDMPGRGTADLTAAAFPSDGRYLAVTAGGTHELVLLDYGKLPWPQGDFQDFAPNRLAEQPGLMRRVALGGRPTDLQWIDDSRLVVANHLSDSLQLVNVADLEGIQSIPLGGPATVGSARQGEAIFYDADRSRHHWFSCHTCHTEGHTSGQVFDTLNDGTYQTFKLTPSLLGVAATRPWTWHGWQTELHDSVFGSLEKTMSPEQPPTTKDASLVEAFLGTLAAPAPLPLTPSAERGRQLFHGKAACTECHQPPRFTSDATYDVGFDSDRFAWHTFNPPSLQGLRMRHRFLHDGRTHSLEQLLTYYHRPGQLAGKPLSRDELQDLIAYLRRL